jgi:hypothetical protein
MIHVLLNALYEIRKDRILPQERDECGRGATLIPPCLKSMALK